MGLVSDIVATYRRPAKVVGRLLDMGQREDRALVFLMAGCGILFIAQMPQLAREAHVTGKELNPLLGASMFALLFIAPLLLYVLAGLSYAVLRLLRAPITGYGARLSLFWALLASGPLLLLNGLVGGFIGPGIQLSIVGFLCFVTFLWFWSSGLRAAVSRGQG